MLAVCPATQEIPMDFHMDFLNFMMGAKNYYAPYPAEGRALPKAMNGRGWVGCICIFFAF